MACWWDQALQIPAQSPTTRTINAPSGEDVAGLGATLTSTSNLGQTTITRGVAAKAHGENQGHRTVFYHLSTTTNTASRCNPSLSTTKRLN